MRTLRSVVRIGTAVLLALVGLGMAIPGAKLLSLGGSAYYLVAGVVILAAAVLLFLRQRSGVYLYGLVLLATLAWGLFEVGLDGWGLMPRLVFLCVFGLWLALPLVWRDTEKPGPKAARALKVAAVVACLALAGSVAFAVATHSPRSYARAFAEPAATTAPGAESGEWTHYGAVLGGGRYSALGQITPANAGDLEQAWVFRAGAKIPGGKREGGLQVTPLMVDGVLYACTAYNSVIALDPVTGKELWRHDPLIEDDAGGHAVCRGMAFFRAPQGTAECPTRLLMATIANRLIALDAKTGQVCESFADKGAASLMEGRGDFPKKWSHPTSPPTIVSGVAVVGAFVADNQSADAPPGVVRGYDAVTGKLKWAFDTERWQDPTPRPAGENYTPSTPNSWTVASGDEALGLVYLAMGNGSPDFFGGQRSAATERFSSAVVALDAATGKVKWTFQAVHHDLWDYDLAAQPVLVDFPTAQGAVPALIQATKTGQIFVLDRRTGAPLTMVEERPVPVSDVKGERASPTQPFSVGMPNVAGPDLKEADMWGITPFDQIACRILFRQARYDGMYTPPRLGKTIRYPGELGGVDWGSVAVDQKRGLLIVNSNHMADLDELITRAQAEKEGLVPKLTPKTHSAPGGPMAGTPYAVHWGPMLSKQGVPCQRPPYGYLTAIDLKTRQVVWSHPLGDARNSGPFGKSLGLPIPLGAPNIGGSVATGGGVIFIAATQDEMFRAIDARNGKVLWQTKLPAAGHATPMTYLGRDGRQYVVIAAGGRSLKDKGGDHFVAFRLPARPKGS
jgi:membrane-bound PQQ-dependent dehydrogenase (glucose/quinate/shikimate family)